MILITVLVGVYLILAVGYFKMVKRAIPDLVEDLPLTMGVIASVWPLAMTYTLIREAVL